MERGGIQKRRGKEKGNTDTLGGGYQHVEENGKVKEEREMEEREEGGCVLPLLRGTNPLYKYFRLSIARVPGHVRCRPDP